MNKSLNELKLNNYKHWIISDLILKQTKKFPKFNIIEFIDNEKWTYEDLVSKGLKASFRLKKNGLVNGDSIAVMIDNPMAFIPIWLGASFLGITFVALNTALRGDVLKHQIEISRPKLVLAENIYLKYFEKIDWKIKNISILNHKNFLLSKELLISEIHQSKMEDISCVMFTSGTSGPAKGVIMPNAHCVLFAIGTIDNYMLNKKDIFYICLPLFHANGLFMQLLACLINRTKAVIRGKFSASNWLNDIINYKITHTNMLGAVAAFVVAQSQTKFDKSHNLKVIGSAPLPKEPENILRRRFGIKEVIPLYGMTEVNIPVYGKLGEKGNGTCGEVYSKYFDVEVRDPNTDEKLKHGITGEIMVRPKISFGFMQGYLGMPDKSFEAYRNFWFHTGDAGFFNKKNQLIFVDRIKDCIRRRGENISSYEVEQAFLKIPQIAEAAAFAVPAKDHGQEDEVMVALMIVQGSKIEYSEWIKNVTSDLAKFSIPLYLRVMKNFPKTQTGKIIKHALRKEGITNDTWKNSF